MHDENNYKGRRIQAAARKTIHVYYVPSDMECAAEKTTTTKTILSTRKIKKLTAMLSLAVWHSNISSDIKLK